MGSGPNDIKSWGRASALPDTPPTPLRPRPPGPPPLTFTRGSRPPYAIRWFGSTALLGHLRHLSSEALASGNLDTRDWMRPQPPEALLDAATAVLGASGDGATLTDRLGRDVWIDFVSDTGDDVDVSAAVGAMVFDTYALADEGGRVLPRGDLLIFGGDTAYPVASADQIATRVVQPWNARLKDLADPRRRVLLGIPGNHDWYGGLDGFARLFRRDVIRDLAVEAGTQPANAVATPPEGDAGSAAGRVYRQLHLDELLGSVTLARDAIESASAILTGQKVRHVSRLVLRGYRAIQEASYWLLPLAPGLDLQGVDRQLRTVDFRQRVFFNERRVSGGVRRRILVCSDPAVAMGERNEPGRQILKACGLSLRDDAMLYLTGDSHHYERREIGATQHVIAGGGGSFLHGTRVHAQRPGKPAACAYPDARTSRHLAASVPWHVMSGTAGLLPHVLGALLAFVELRAFRWGATAGWITTALLGVITVAAMLGTMSMKGRRRGLATLIAAGHGVALTLLPLAIGWAWTRVFGQTATTVATAGVMAVAGPLLLGHFLLTLVVTGLDPWSAYSALGHPGFKHFVRLCVRRDGHVEGWVIGKDDPLAPGAAEMIDRFTF
jgi:hypothetical protein